MLCPGLLLMAWSACFLNSPTKEDQHRLALSTMGRVLPHQSPIKKMYHGLTRGAITWGHFLKWGFLFHNYSSLRQVDIELASMVDRKWAEEQWSKGVDGRGSYGNMPHRQQKDTLALLHLQGFVGLHFIEQNLPKPSHGILADSCHFC